MWERMEKFDFDFKFSHINIRFSPAINQNKKNKNKAMIVNYTGGCFQCSSDLHSWYNLQTNVQGSWNGCNHGGLK